MPDDLSKRGPADATRINIHEPWEVDYWCKKFGCTSIDLIVAVSLVGVMVKDVKKQLGK